MSDTAKIERTDDGCWAPTAHEFFTERCGDICNRIYDAAVKCRKGQVHTYERERLVHDRIALLEEHKKHCHNRDVMTRMEKTIAYNRQLLVNPCTPYRTTL